MAAFAQLLVAIDEGRWVDVRAQLQAMQKSDARKVRGAKNNSLLHLLAVNGSCHREPVPADLVEWALKCGCSPNAENEMGHTPLFAGILHQASAETLRPLLECKRVDCTRWYDMHPIDTTCAKAYFGARRAAAESGRPTPPCPSCGVHDISTALHEAGYDAELVRALLRREDVNANARSLFDETPAHRYARRYQLSGLRVLLDRGGADMHFANHARETPAAILRRFQVDTPPDGFVLVDVVGDDTQCSDDDWIVGQA